MIKLSVEEYCHDCDDFEPEVTKIYCNDGYDRPFQQSVRCQNCDRCQHIYLYLKHKIEKGETK